jgi:hypothetical protein
MKQALKYMIEKIDEYCANYHIPEMVKLLIPQSCVTKIIGVRKIYIDHVYIFTYDMKAET